MWRSYDAVAMVMDDMVEVVVRLCLPLCAYFKIQPLLILVGRESEMERKNLQRPWSTYRQTGSEKMMDRDYLPPTRRLGPRTQRLCQDLEGKNNIYGLWNGIAFFLKAKKSSGAKSDPGDGSPPTDWRKLLKLRLLQVTTYLQQRFSLNPIQCLPLGVQLLHSLLQ
jgi:hypothetical protein